MLKLRIYAILGCRFRCGRATSVITQLDWRLAQNQTPIDVFLFSSCHAGVSSGLCVVLVLFIGLGTLTIVYLTSSVPVMCCTVPVFSLRLDGF